MNTPLSVEFANLGRPIKRTAILCVHSIVVDSAKKGPAALDWVLRRWWKMTLTIRSAGARPPVEQPQRSARHLDIRRPPEM